MRSILPYLYVSSVYRILSQSTSKSRSLLTLRFLETYTFMALRDLAKLKMQYFITFPIFRDSRRCQQIKWP